MNFNILSIFSGCGGMDLGFKNAGFDICMANEFDKTIWKTYETNFPETTLLKCDIHTVDPTKLPNFDGIIGGPPCQSWSFAGAYKGIEDNRGKLFFEYIRLLKSIKPKFFVAENVPGILSNKHITAFNNIQDMFKNAGYDITVKIIDASQYEVPQTRKRVIIVGFKSDLNVNYTFPNIINDRPLTLKDCIYDLKNSKPIGIKRTEKCTLQSKLNNEYLIDTFSPRYLSRNRCREWNKPSFTIPATGRHIPLHPDSNAIKIDTYQYEIHEPYRRLSVRECARIQTFPDDFKFIYTRIDDGYKMIGNAVPPKMAYYIAKSIKEKLIGF